MKDFVWKYGENSASTLRVFALKFLKYVQISILLSSLVTCVYMYIRVNLSSFNHSVLWTTSSNIPVLYSRQLLYWLPSQFFPFYCTSSYASAVSAVVILSVCLCHTYALWQNQTSHCWYIDATRKAITLVF